MLTRLCWYEECRLRPEFVDRDVIIQDRLGVVGHAGEEIRVEDHLAVVKVEAANLQEESERIQRRDRFTQDLGLAAS